MTKGQVLQARLSRAEDTAGGEAWGMDRVGTQCGQAWGWVSWGPGALLVKGGPTRPRRGVQEVSPVFRN